MTGQKYTWMDAGIAALTGAFGTSKTVAVIGGALAAAKSYFVDGRSVGESITIGVSTAVGSYFTVSNLAAKSGSGITSKATTVTVDGIIGVGYNMSTAALTKERTSSSSKRKTETTKVSKAKQKPKKRVLRLIPRRYWNRALNQWRTYYDRVIEYR